MLNAFSGPCATGCTELFVHHGWVVLTENERTSRAEFLVALVRFPTCAQLEDQNIASDDLVAKSLGHYAFKGQLEQEHVLLVGNGGACSARAFPRLKTRKFSTEVQRHHDSFVVWEEYKQAKLLTASFNQPGPGAGLLGHMGWERYLDGDEDEDELRRTSLPHLPQHSHLASESQAELRRRSEAGAGAGAPHTRVSQTRLSHHQRRSGSSARSLDFDGARAAASGAATWRDVRVRPLDLEACHVLMHA